MSWLEQLATSNMPGAIAMIVLILFVAAFMVFVLPMMKENEALKKRNEDLEISHKNMNEIMNEVLAAVERLVDSEHKSHADIDDMIKDLNASNININAKLEDIKEGIDKTYKGLTGKDTVESLVEGVKSVLRELHIEDQSKLEKIISSLDNIKSLNEDIKDRQSTLNGALLLANNSHRGLK